jgi:hypothetical protein
MLAQILPPVIMFGITIAAAALFFVPITVFPRKNELVNFYWVGFWGFLVAIASLSGSSNALLLMDYDSQFVTNGLTTVITVCFVLFVMFGWFRLSAKVLAAGITHGLKKLKR